MADVKQLMMDAKVLKVLAVSHPQLIEEATSNVIPMMEDLIMIRDVHDYVLRSHKPSNSYQDKLVFIAVILRLFNPDALIIDCKLRNGLRRELAICLNDSGQNASYYIGQARAYMSIKPFKATVTGIVEGYLNQEGKA